jgi:predicted nuclease with TOPRIM domain
MDEIVAEINIFGDTQDKFDKEIKLYNETQKKIFNLINANNKLYTNIVELKQDITVHVDHIKSLKYLNSQLEEKLNKVEKENKKLKLQIIEKKQNNIITFYC